MTNCCCWLLICRVFVARLVETSNKNSANEQQAAKTRRFMPRVTPPLGLLYDRKIWYLADSGNSGARFTNIDTVVTFLVTRVTMINLLKRNLRSTYKRRQATVTTVSMLVNLAPGSCLSVVTLSTVHNHLIDCKSYKNTRLLDLYAPNQILVRSRTCGGYDTWWC